MLLSPRVGVFATRRLQELRVLLAGVLACCALVAVSALPSPASASAKAKRRCPHGQVRLSTRGRHPRGLRARSCVKRPSRTPMRTAAQRSDAFDREFAGTLASMHLRRGWRRPSPRTVRRLQAAARKLRGPYLPGMPFRPPGGRAIARAAETAPPITTTVQIDTGEANGVKGSVVAEVDRQSGIVEMRFRGQDKDGNAIESISGAKPGIGVSSGCPDASGKVEGHWRNYLGESIEVAAHGTTTRYEETTDYDVKYKGQVGDNAKLQTYDYDASSAVQVKSEKRVTATGKLLAHLPTQVYRGRYSATGIKAFPSEAPDIDAGTVGAWGPSSGYGIHDSDRYVQAIRAAWLGGWETADGLLRNAQERFYDEELCAGVDLTAAPSPAAAGGTVTYQATAQSYDLHKVRASYDALTGCPGNLSPGGATAEAGEPARFTDTDGGREWHPGHGPCITVVALSRAGKARAHLDTPVAGQDVPLLDLQIHVVSDWSGQRIEDYTISGPIDRANADGSGSAGSGGVSGYTYNRLLANGGNCNGLTDQVQLSGGANLFAAWADDESGRRLSVSGQATDSGVTDYDVVAASNGTTTETSTTDLGGCGPIATTATYTVSNLRSAPAP